MMDMSPAKIIGGIAAVGAACTIVLWGVPSYIKVQVRTHVAAELQGTDFDEAKDAADANTATLGAISTQLAGMEQRMIARDEFIMDYFRDQAERNRESGQ